MTNGLIDNCVIKGTLINKSEKSTLISLLSGFIDIMGGVSTINNCINNIDIDGSKFTSGATYIGGIVRNITGNCMVVNCINNGNITSTLRPAGIVSFVSNSTLLENNLNTGTIKSTDTTSHTDASASGILAWLTSGTVTLKNNINLGNVENSGIAETVGVGGIIGSVYRADNTRTAFLYNNINSGNVTANSTTEGNAGGLIGFTNSTASLFNNINTGTIESKGVYAGGAIGRTDTSSTVTLDGNLNYGKVSKESL